MLNSIFLSTTLAYESRSSFYLKINNVMKTINHETYVSLEIAKLLKEAGFNWKVKYMYRNNNSTLYICTETSYKNTPKPNKCPMYWQYAAPTLTIAQKWLREIKNIQCIVFWKNDIFSSYKWTVDSLDFEKTYYGSSNSYEKSLEMSIKKALEIILNK